MPTFWSWGFMLILVLLRFSSISYRHRARGPTFPAPPVCAGGARLRASSRQRRITVFRPLRGCSEVAEARTYNPHGPLGRGVSGPAVGSWSTGASYAGPDSDRAHRGNRARHPASALGSITETILRVGRSRRLVGAGPSTTATIPWCRPARFPCSPSTFVASVNRSSTSSIRPANPRSAQWEAFRFQRPAPVEAGRTRRSGPGGKWVRGSPPAPAPPTGTAASFRPGSFVTVVNRRGALPRRGFVRTKCRSSRTSTNPAETAGALDAAGRSPQLFGTDHPRSLISWLRIIFRARRAGLLDGPAVRAPSRSPACSAPHGGRTESPATSSAPIDDLPCSDSPIFTWAFPFILSRDPRHRRPSARSRPVIKRRQSNSLERVLYRPRGAAGRPVLFPGASASFRPGGCHGRS